MKTIQRHALAGALVALALTVAGCAGGDKAAEAPAPASPSAAEQAEQSGTGTGTTMTASGPACARLPQGDAGGGLQAMALQPAGTAASTNPLLTQLANAAQQAGLVDTLNSTGPFTIFAPVNDAFAKMPEADLNAVLADKTKLTRILNYHVHTGEALTSDQLAEKSTLKMANESEITLAESSDDTLNVNGQAKVVCSNIKVGNGVVHLIDGVLMPSA
jgi:uncharacterized surface protein with fasciclin (FAS1) repeats